MGIGFVIKSAILAAFTTFSLSFGGLGHIMPNPSVQEPVHPVNHGAVVSATAQKHDSDDASAAATPTPSVTPTPNHGAAVSAVAKEHGISVRALVK